MDNMCYCPYVYSSSFAIKIKSPLDCETSTYRHWSERHETASQNYSVVRLVKTMGKDFSREAVIQLHDRICNESRHSKLA